MPDCQIQVRDKVEDYLHDQLVEAVQVKRKPKSWLIWVLFCIFLLASTAICSIYYVLYIHDQQIRVDIDYADRQDHLKTGQKITCDCALPISINPERILADPDFFQPDFKQCLQTNLAPYYPKPLLDHTVKLLAFNFLAVPLNTNIKDFSQNYQNIIVSQDGDILDKIGHITILRYWNEITNAFLNYMSIYTSDLVFSSSLFNYLPPSNQNEPSTSTPVPTTPAPVPTSKPNPFSPLATLAPTFSPANSPPFTATPAPQVLRNQDGFQDLLQTIDLEDRKHEIMTIITGCYQKIDIELIHPRDFTEGLTSDDCLPKNCHFFAKYTAYQSIVLIFTFYLAVIGYVLFILQCGYQKLTTITED